MNLVKTIRPAIITASLLGSALIGGTASATPNTSTYSMQLSGNTVSVYETNSEAVNAVEADFTYSGAASSFNITPGVGSTFTTCLSQTSASVSCTILGGSASAGSAHLVATLAFTPKAGVSNANITVSMAASSMILASSDSSETLNHSTLPSISYNYTAPVATPPVATPPAPTPSGGTSGSTTGGSTTGGTTSGNSTGGSKTPTAPTKKNNNNNQQNSKHNAPAPQPKHIKDHRSGFVTSTAYTLVILGAAAYWLVIRKRTQVAPAKVYKLATSAKSKTAGKSKKPSTSSKATATRASIAKKAVAKTKQTTKTTSKKKA